MWTQGIIELSKNLKFDFVSNKYVNYNSNKHAEEISCDKARQFKTSENLNKNHEKFLLHDEKVRTLAVSIYKIPILLLANQNQAEENQSSEISETHSKSSTYSKGY